MDLATLRRFGFLTLPNYSMIAVANAIEALRMADRVLGEPAYEWQAVTLDGAPAQASNGLAIHPTVALGAAPRFDLVFVCGGIDVRHATGRSLAAALRRLAREGVGLGALCTGAFALAEAGLLRGYRCAIHWENLEPVREEFPDVAFVEDIYAIDRDRLTCTGGIAPLDMMLGVIGARFGRGTAEKVSTQFILDRLRPGEMPQPSPSHSVPPTAPPRLEHAVQMIARQAETRLSAAQVAEGVHVSPRQLERLFRRHLDTTPAAFAAAARLERARGLLRQTHMSVTEVAVACGFASAAYFSTAYRSRFGRSPRADRDAAEPRRERSAAR